MKKKLLALLFATIFALMVVGCNQQQDTSETSTSTSEENAIEATEEEATAEPSMESELSAQEPYVVKIVTAGTGTTEDCAAVAAAAGEITQAKFNTTIELVRFGYGEWEDQVQLMLASGEQIDLMASLWLGVNAAASDGQILPLDDLLSQYGQEMLDSISKEDWTCTSVGGQIYGVRNNKELAAGYGVAMDTEILETLDTDYTTIKSEQDLTPLLREVKEKYPDIYPIVSDFGTMGNYLLSIDWLGKDFGVLDDCSTASTEVVNLWTSDTYMELTKNRHSWVVEGLMMPDSTTNSETAANLIAAGKAFCYLTDTKPGIEGQWARGTGKDITVFEVIPAFSITTNLNNLWYIPYTSMHPERAMQVLNEMYTNPDLSNTFIYGVEGTHYVVSDAELGLVDYPEGVDPGSLGYSSDAWMWPNELISYSWSSDGATIWSDTLEFNKNAVQSPAKGFAWDSTSVANEIVACNTVLSKYRDGLDTGELDPEIVISQMAEEFNAAGIDKIITEKQKQLDEWLASH